MEPDAGDDGRPFEAVTLIEGCLVTTPLEFYPSLSVWPVGDARHRTGVAAVMDSLLEENGWDLGASSLAGLRSDGTDLPLAVLYHGGVATDLADAYTYNQVAADLVLSALSLKRGASGTPLMTVVRVELDDGVVRYFSRSMARPYTGNLMGGFLSGEDVDDLRRVLEATQDRLCLLWLNACRDLRGDRDPVFRIHRWWNLVEGIALSRSLPKRPVVRSDGAEIKWPKTGKPFDTGRQVGAVYMHIRDRFDERNVSERGWGPKGSSLWDVVAGWCGLRNAIAHYGYFDGSNKVMKEQWWFPAAKQLWAWHTDGTSSILSSIEALGELVLDWELDHRRGHDPEPVPSSDSKWTRVEAAPVSIPPNDSDWASPKS